MYKAHYKKYVKEVQVTSDNYRPTSSIVKPKDDGPSYLLHFSKSRSVSQPGVVCKIPKIGLAIDAFSDVFRNRKCFIFQKNCFQYLRDPQFNFNDFKDML